jgi:hypothetical protein
MACTPNGNSQMINPAELIELADRIDNRLGPISGRMADRIAVLLRQIAMTQNAGSPLPKTPAGGDAA